jgi:hypothetical protein
MGLLLNKRPQPEDNTDTIEETLDICPACEGEGIEIKVYTGNWCYPDPKEPVEYRGTVKCGLCKGKGKI